MTYEQALRLVHKGKYAEADELIVEALEKQISVKPKYIPLHTFQCSVCKNPWLRWEQVYCDRCGTKLDWIPEGFAGDAKIIEIYKRSKE